MTSLNPTESFSGQSADMRLKNEIGFGYLNMEANPKIVFLDRDGIINVDHGYVVDPNDFQFVDGFTTLYKKLCEMSYTPVIITNQSGVARGYFSLQQVQTFHDHINNELKANGLPPFDHIYVCPHHINGTVEEYSIYCDCRNKPGMIKNFMKDNDLTSLSAESIFIGDKESDVGIGLSMKLRTFQLDTGKYNVHEKAEHVVKKLTDVIPLLK